ncbi:MAG: hypothetical protein RXN92_00395 [Thermoplasmatales archaeon]
MDVDLFVKELLKEYADQKQLIQLYHETMFAILESSRPGQSNTNLVIEVVNELRNILPSEIENIKIIHKLIEKYGYMNAGHLYEMENLVPNCRIVSPKDISKGDMGDLISNLSRAEICTNEYLRKITRQVNNGEIVKDLQSIVISHEKHVVRLRKLWDKIDYLGMDIS